MSCNVNNLYNNLLPSIISDIKSYNGTDPLLPWLRGIRQMKDLLHPQLLKEKLPRFLQKCCEGFVNDRRYSNDVRFIRVWLQLMDFANDPKGVLRTMEMNRIGMKKSLFYLAYALYYEKTKKFDAAEKIYHLGMQNLAEPAEELVKSYELFLQRMERRKTKTFQYRGRKTNGKSLCAERVLFNIDKLKPGDENSSKIDGQQARTSPKDYLPADTKTEIPFQETEQDENKKFYGNDAVVSKFINAAIDGKSNAEDARHHGLVEPTITTKEAMDEINNMFREPLEPSFDVRKVDRSNPKTGNICNNGLKVFTDENLQTEIESTQPDLSKDSLFPPLKISVANDALSEPFEICNDCEEPINAQRNVSGKDVKAKKYVSHEKESLLADPRGVKLETLKEPNCRRVYVAGLREDTVVHKFVGSTISDESRVENVWHHGLVEPTINLKEAMSDINSMFGKPIEFSRKSRRKNQGKTSDEKSTHGQFLILPDDGLDEHKVEDDISCRLQNSQSFEIKASPRNLDKVPDHQSNFLILPDDELNNLEYSSLPSFSNEDQNDLFAKTVCTKEALDEINRLFAMPMDF